MSDPAPIEFEPAERVTRRRRNAIAAFGLLTWIAALAILVVVALRTDDIRVALAITLGSFILAAALLSVSAALYRRRLR